MIKVRFSNKNNQLIVSKIHHYYEILDTLCLQLFIDPKKQFKIVDENEKADICIVGIQHTDNNLLRPNEVNILLCVENLTVGRTHYEHFRKFGRYDNPMINIYIYNDESEPKILHQFDKEVLVIPIIYQRIQFFNWFQPKIDLIPWTQRKFCLFTSRNQINHNKELVLHEICELGKVDFIETYKISTSSCYHSDTLLQIFSKYKFIICFENSKTDGYITEKIFNAYMAGCIPIYDGAPNIGKYLEPETFLHYDENLLSNIEMIDQEKYNQIQSLKKAKDLDFSVLNDYFIKINFYNNR
jgi:hypothetical protein